MAPWEGLPLDADLEVLVLGESPGSCLQLQGRISPWESMPWKKVLVLACNCKEEFLPGKGCPG
ncbi:hypothetical protein PSF70_17160 [Methanosarcina mazei]|nr:hypothetical protein PSF70_17115 [Methanosarcina mazei]WIM43162.1 hypothetical protein PSF70_17160 [Methanosarcina mazei]